MPEPSPQARRYGEKEIGKILERATELQQSEPMNPGAAGLTLAELEEVAAEAGIDVRHIRRAAYELAAPPRESTAWSRFLGAERRIVRETVLPGEVPETSFEDLVAVLQSTVRDPGHPSLLGRTLTWQGGNADASRKTRVVVSSRDGATTIRVEENLSQLAGGLFGGIGGGVGGGVGFGLGFPLAIALQSEIALVGLPLAWLGLTYFGVRTLYRNIVRGRRRVVEELFSRLAGAAEDAIATASLEAD